ncbi:glycosyltransferase family 2 protein [Candidatus Gottesmanbacteria bacterium]|nr:glycosyltransferase family 2 protein [Candidatus Gottesmanbacteria bacterium]
MNISAIIISRNEEENISACIKALDFADEIIVIDNCSSDNTRELAEKSGAKVYEISGLDFSYLRNIGKEKAASQWLLYIDADERVSKNLSIEIKKAVKNPESNSAFSIVRKNYFLGKPSPKLERINRLIKKDALIGWHGSLHESPIITGSIGELQFYLLHYTHKNISSMVAKTNEWSAIEAQLLYKSNHPLMREWRFFRILVTSFFRSYIQNQAWKMGTTGFIESTYQAFSNFITYAKLWEKQNKSEVANEK